MNDQLMNDQFMSDQWRALATRIIENGDEVYALCPVKCGKLKVSSGKLVCCDPFSGMDKTGNPYIDIPRGDHEVVVTVATLNPEKPYKSYRNAYASLIIDETLTETKRKDLLPFLAGGVPAAELEGDDVYVFEVDAGTACFVDAQAVEEGMPEEYEWYNLFDNDTDDGCWFDLLDDSDHIHEGIANVRLPEAGDNSNLIMFQSGWGDGVYSIVGGYDDQDRLAAIHIDFGILPDEDGLSPEIEEAAVQIESDDSTPEEKKRPWWKFW